MIDQQIGLAGLRKREAGFEQPGQHRQPTGYDPVGIGSVADLHAEGRTRSRHIDAHGIEPGQVDRAQPIDRPGIDIERQLHAVLIRNPGDRIAHLAIIEAIDAQHRVDQIIVVAGTPIDLREIGIVIRKPLKRRQRLEAVAERILVQLGQIFSRQEVDGDAIAHVAIVDFAQRLAFGPMRLAFGLPFGAAGGAIALGILGQRAVVRLRRGCCSRQTVADIIGIGRDNVAGRTVRSVGGLSLRRKHVFCRKFAGPGRNIPAFWPFDFHSRQLIERGERVDVQRVLDLRVFGLQDGAGGSG